MEKLNIGIFTDTYFPQVNGVTYTIAAWKKKLEKYHNIYVYYPKSSYKPKKNEFPFRSVEFKFYKGYNIAFPKGITQKSRNLDIVHIHGLFTMAMAGVYVSGIFKLPRILTYHTPADDYIDYITRNPAIKKTLMKLYNFWEKKLLNSCDVVTAPSKQIKKRLIEKGVERDIIVLSNGIDLDFFKYTNPEEFKKKYNIVADKIIGFCGRFGYEKHLEDLIGIADEFDGLIIVAGKGPATQYYKKLARGKKNVKFLGFLSRRELLQFYSSLDLFIFPSIAETQGLVALEAMACGVPVVGANALALKDTIKHGRTGYLYQQGDTKDLLRKIDMAYKNREKFSKNALEYVKEHSLDRTIERLLEIYEDLVKDKR
ncbi:MAG: glycosyltransferase family 4 protein [Candidatus Altiarchaeales archaeon]|nr:MAG: glycosyltransferase family 4 protein [Candidatus Altiarchaeales archaeon]RLI94599.1 MAG: glycosyltransferase family 4 protein [Candidatus Altiarchaeales archaeon]RLI95311.1 MAG: glycosyltransferase family 4 protein [Candidatus Altiarchaeales archaeon]HDO82861.1 glycosyltransferase family 4 protein [Candidatus Altiarchaeales archaeon]HEX55510.1 glycosyltransferase family 4 protein [Candidatus Altiarchaeales archaeon]